VGLIVGILAGVLLGLIGVIAYCCCKKAAAGTTIIASQNVTHHFMPGMPGDNSMQPMGMN
jgi:hypothetical protein